jgi:hypothetical protein
MPDAVILAAARDHVYELRHRYHSDVELGPDSYLLRPLLDRMDAIVADLLEYHLDVAGGIDGVAAALDRLTHYARHLPGAPAWAPLVSGVIDVDYGPVLAADI